MHTSQQVTREAYAYRTSPDRCTIYFSNPQETFCRALLAAKTMDSIVVSPDFTTLSFSIRNGSFRPFPRVANCSQSQAARHGPDVAPIFSYSACVRMIAALGRQISSMEQLHHTFAWLDCRDMYLVNNTCVYLGIDSMCALNTHTQDAEHFTLSSMIPPPQPSLFLAPEIRGAERLPSRFSRTAVYHSLGSFANYCLSGDNEDTFVSTSFGRSIVDTKLYWFVLRCMHTMPDKRLMLFV